MERSHSAASAPAVAPAVASVANASGPRASERQPTGSGWHALRAGLLGALVAGLACVPPIAPASPAISAPTPERVLVYYPPGTCPAQLEIELFDRESGAWRAHPEHPRLPPGACAWEEPGSLLNELRVRCVDPSGARRPSEWVVGAERAGEAPECVTTE